MDIVSTSTRSDIMRRVRGKNTRPELIVRKILYSRGYRYRLHLKSLPGKPDIVFQKLRKIIFVHGCFWHQHARCDQNRPPKSREDFWGPKLQSNKANDKKVMRQLNESGWDLLIIWECELANLREAENKIVFFMNN